MVSPDKPDIHVGSPPEPDVNHLHSHAIDLMHLHVGKRNWEALTLDEQGRHRVEAGESLSAIALKELTRRHEIPQNDAKLLTSRLKDEMQRIVALNAKAHPDLLKHPDWIREGWQLQISDEHISKEKIVAEKSVAEKKIATEKPVPASQWEQAQPGVMTVVHKGHHVLAGKDTWLFVDGGEVVLNPGAHAFVAKGVVKMALPGSLVVGGGKDVLVNDYGATLQIRDQQTEIVRVHDPRYEKQNNVEVATRTPSANTPTADASAANGPVLSTRAADAPVANAPAAQPDRALADTQNPPSLNAPATNPEISQLTRRSAASNGAPM